MQKYEPNPPAIDPVAPLRIAVGIATVGRPHVLQAVLLELTQQSRPADRVVICAPTADDVAGADCAGTAELILGPRGLTRQRNAVLGHVREIDVLVFFDDDFLPAPSYLATVEQVFRAHPDVVMMTGDLIADGIIGPGIAIEEARRKLAASRTADQGPNELQDLADGYGCNMAVRLAPAENAHCRFDERLPLYGWLEDVDFSRQLARHGRIVKAAAARGVHLGIKHGRQSGRRLGYSQIANPIYLARKGTFPWPRALRLMSRNIAANCVRSVKPEPYVDRRGRVAGNLKALRDLLAGKLDPQRILEL